MKNQSGTVSIKVAIQKSYRVIKISFRSTLEDLHLAIQRAFDFDDDHLYAFYMNGDKRSRDNVYWGVPEESPSASDTTIGKFHWVIGHKFLYRFDFGDDWYFKCKVLEVNPNELMDSNTIVIKEKGESPEQYPMEEDFEL
jgi:hypothetical protein